MTQKIPQFSKIKEVIRADGSSYIAERDKTIRLSDFNNSKLPYEDKEVDFAISFEVIENKFDGVMIPKFLY